MTKVLFTITEEELETGLRGYPCGYCVTSYVDPEKGLLYAGIPVADLAEKKPEEVIELLYFGKIDGHPDFQKELKQRAFLSEKTIEAVGRLPKEGHPMKFFAAALLIMGMIEGKSAYREDCLDVLAKIPLLAALVINERSGKKASYVSDREKGYMENFTDMLQIGVDTDRTVCDVFRLFNILHYDHGGGNLSVFVGKAVASGLEDLYGSLSASLCALAGSRHGRANQDALSFVKETLQELGEDPPEDSVRNFLRGKLERGELLFGFGHAVLRVEDPRASLLYEYADTHYGDRPLIKTARLLRKAVPEILKENPKISCPYPNVDAISGALLTAAGFSYPEYFTVLFGMARCVGVSIQILYERTEARGGKGTPIVRPKYIYKARE